MRKIYFLLGIWFASFAVDAREWKPIGPEAASIQNIVPDRNPAGAFYIITGNDELTRHLYRTIDNALTWHRCPLVAVSQIVVHPKTSEVYALTIDRFRYESHLWYSSNGGRAFFPRASGRGSPSQIFLDPFDSRRLYGAGLGNSVLSVSKNGGFNWIDFGNFPFRIGKSLHKLGGRPIAGISFNDVLIPASSPKTIFVSGQVFAEIDIKMPFLIRSTDRGQTWKVLEARLSDTFEPYKFHTDPIFPERAFAFNNDGIKELDGESWVRISPVSLENLISLPDARNSLLGSRFNPVNGNMEFLFSSNGGRTWSDIDLDLNHRIRVLQSMTNGLLAGTNGGGLYRRTTGQGWHEANHGLKEARVTEVEQNRSGTVIYALLNNHFLYHSSTAGRTWQNISFSFPFAADDSYIMPLLLNPLNEGNILVDHGPIAVSKDAGLTWIIIGSSFDNPAFDPNQSTVVYFSSHKRVWKSIESGTNPSPLPLKFSFSNIQTIVDPYVSSTLYFLSDSIFKSMDGGKTMHGLATVQQPISMAPLPDPNSFVVLSADGSVYRTNDGGESWSLLSKVSLVSYGMRKIAAASSNHLFIVQPESFLESMDGGVSWKDITAEFGRDFKARRNFILDIGDPKSPRFYVATSRGVFVALGQ